MVILAGMKNALVLLLLGALPMLASAQSTLSVDQATRDALQAAERGQVTPALPASHPLFAWMEMAALRQRIDSLTPASVQSFLRRNAGSPAGETFRDAWLAQLAKRGDWNGFLQAWQPRQDNALRCAYWQALAATGQQAEPWQQQALQLWRHSGTSLPAQCDPVFEQLDKTGGISDELRWARFDAALAAGQPAVMRRAARGLPAEQLALANRYASYVQAADASASQWPKTPRSRAVATAGLSALARSNPDAAQTLLPFSVVVLEGPQVVIVARSTAHAEGERILAYGLHLGSRLPAHATSTGRVLLAALPKEELREWLRTHSLPRLTAYTQTEAPTLRKTLTQVRADDYCVASEEHEIGVHALAVPLRDLQGRTVAALNVVTSPQRLQAARLEKDLLPVLRDAARELRPLL